MKKLIVPGDKSITQRFLILAGLAEGKSLLRGALASTDCFSTADTLQKLGVQITNEPDKDEFTILGSGLQGFRNPSRDLDFQNSGTGARLMLGVLSAQLKLSDVVITGDKSLVERPMDRVVEPLRRSGAQIEYIENRGVLPISITGKKLLPIIHKSSVPSAQVKSALLLASLVSGQSVIVSEPSQSRDHTERILAASGVKIREELTEGRWEVEIDVIPGKLSPFEVDIPGDFSSAAFFVGYAMLGGAGNGLVIEDVGLNPTRTGLLDVLARMGAKIEISKNSGSYWGEPLGSIEISSIELKGTEIQGEEVPYMIDEFPLLAILGSRAVGVTKIRGAKELRFKESDRIRALVDNMRTIGLEVEEFEDGLEILGTEKPLKGRVYSHGDHRIAMAFGILAALPGNEIEIEGKEVADVSFPGFWKILSEFKKDSTKNG